MADHEHRWEYRGTKTWVQSPSGGGVWVSRYLCACGKELERTSGGVRS